MADSPKLRQLEELQQRQEAILAGLQDHIEYPDLESDEQGLAGLDASRAAFADVGSHEFEYKPEFQDSPGAGKGRFAGPMTSELKSIPGVVEQGGPGGMEQVNTPRLTMANASATGELARSDQDKQRQLDELNARMASLQEATGGDDPDEVMREAQSGRF